MVIVMPAGHTRQNARFTPPPATGSGGAPPPDEFVQDFVTTSCLMLKSITAS
ncbi:MAG: hypothetical protein IPM55_21815 [Acidobacteria bacterium]|nr:hypothetical protein [Acidobacteriota bacterium]